MKNPSTYIKLGKVLFAFFLIIGSFGTYAQDNDLDGILNLADLDDDNDGILDAVEGCRDTDIAGTIGLGNNVVNATYNLEGTDITYTLNNPDNANIYGFDAGLQGMAIRLEGAAGNTGSLSSEYSTPIAYVGFKMTDFDNDTRATIEVYDENNVLYDLTLEGVLSVGSAITQTGNLFVADATDIDGDDPADDPITSILFYFESQVSRIVINFDYPSSSTTRFTQPVFCSLDSDADGIINIFDLDSDNDGIYDAVEASHAQPHTNGIVNGTVGSDGIPDSVQTAPNDGMVNYSVAENANDVDTIYDFLDLDTDGDGCFDVIEAGHLDQDIDGVLGTSPVVVDSNGLVISDANGPLNNGTDSYTGTNIGVTTIGQAFTIDTNPQDQSISNGDDATFTVVVSTAGLTFLWEESSDNGSTFDPVTDGGRYSGSTTESLTISNVNNGMNGNQYRVTVMDANNICSFIQSTIASLYTRPIITINDTSADEGSNMTFTITASDVVSQNVNYTISYTNNTTTTADYSGPTTVTMASGSTSVTFNVLAIDDDWVEQTQQDFTATISTNSNQVIISDDEGVGTIVDTDIAYVVGGNFDIEEGEVIQYRLFLSTDANSGGQQYVGIEDAYIVDFATEIDAGSSSPATDGADFNSFSTTATFPAGSIAGTEIFIAVPTTEDTLVEPSEEFNGVKSRNSAEATKYGSGPSRVGINTERSSLRIHDDDTATITLEDISINEDVGTTNYTFTLAGQTRDAFDISYQTNNNTADSATDYTSATSTVSFNGTDGEVRSIVLSITDDLILESTEDFTIVPSYTGIIPSLANAVAQNVIFANNPGTVTINDNDLEAVDDYTTVYHAQVIKTIDVLSNDNYGNSGPATTNALQIITAPSNGTISINDNGTPADPSDDLVNYDPTPTYTGPDSFTYRITNSLGTSDTATVFINVSDAEVRAAFTIRYQGEIKGDMTTIANNVLSRHPTNAYNGTGDNNNFTDNVFVDIDSDPTTFNSTNANFSNLGLPCQNIVGAYLYWAAANNEYDFQNGNGQPEPVWNFEDVKLMLPGQTSYTTVTADEVIFNGRATDFENNPYICIKDITAEVNALADPFGTYQLGNVKATEGTLQYDDGIAGVAGGWQIVFVYESGSLNTRNITLYDGYAHVSSLIGSTDFDFYGFETIPVGNVNASVLLGSLEGDRNLTGDQFLIRDTSANWTNISSGLRSADNYFNSKITIGGSDYIDRNPASTNTLGYDVSLFDLNNTGNSLIGNNQTDTSLRITSTGDTYGVYLMGMSVEVYEPSLGALSLSPIAGTYNPGDVIPMVLDVNNTGNDNVLNLTISTILPNDVDFIDATPLPPGVTYTFDTLTRELEFQVEDGYTNIGDAYNLEFNLQVKDQCYYLETVCGSSFQFQATATFIGEISGNSFTTDSSGTTDTCGIGQNDPTVININQPNQVNWSTAVGALNSTVSCDDTNALNTAQTLEPVTEFCNFTLTKTSGTFAPTSPGCNSVGTYTNTWVFTDACGRTSQPFTQVISINDSTPPTFIGVLPVDTIAAYDNIPNAEVLNASDTCDTNAQVNMVETYLGDNSGTTYTIVRTWTASDCAGNTTEHVQNIYVTENGEQIGLTINDISVDEGAGTATFTVTLTGTTTANFTVDYSGIDNTAIASGDFSVTSSALSFNGNHGETLNVVVTINDDNILEITETYYIELSNLSTNEIGIIDNTGLGTITDNDGSGAGDGISVADFTVNENVGTVDFVITYTGPTVANAFTVDFAVADGAAISPSDYSVFSATGNLSFPVNTTSGTSQIVTVTIIDDNLIETDEDLSITLSNISNPLVAMLDANGLGTITDNDSVTGTGLDFDVLNVTVNEGDGTATFNVTLTGNVPGGFTVDYATANDSAGEPNDYISNINTLTFNGIDGETYPISINIIDDSLLEVTERFFLNLSNISTTLVGINTPQATGTITDNDSATITLESVGFYENEGTVGFNFSFTGNAENAFTINYASSDATAIAPADYTSATNTLNFTGTDGEIQTAFFTLIDDSIEELSERFTVTGSYTGPAMNLTFTDNPGTLTILDDDFSGTYQPFVCDGRLYQTIQIGGDMILFEINTTTGSLIQMANLSDNGVVSTINSIGSNPIDNFMYGIKSTSAPYTFYRIDANGLVENLGNISGLTGNNQAGAFDINGNYYVTGSSQRLYRIDINSLTATLIGSTGIDVSDIAINPADGKIYGWNQNLRQLVTISNTDASATPIGSPNTQYSVFGALYYDANNGIIAYGNDVNNTGLTQETLVTIDPNTGVVTPLVTGPSTNTNDGCSCVFTIEFDKRAESTSINLCNDRIISFTYTVHNNTGIDLTNVNFGESLLNGLLYASEPYNASTGMVFTESILGQSSSNLVLDIPVGENSFTIDVEVPINYDGPDQYSNITYLDNLNSNATALPFRVDSDNPDTATIDDITTIEIIALDNDGDNVPDCFDLDDDNDGILDTVEGIVNTDGDSLIDAFDSDSDNDGCMDAIEAGHTDPDNDGFLGNSPVTVDLNGLVTGQGGYTGTTNGVTTALISVNIDNQPVNQRVNITGATTFNATISGGGDLSYQWQESNDNGATWTDIIDNANYGGATTTTLSLSTILSVQHDNDYRLLVTDAENLCNPTTTTNSADLFVRPSITIDDATASEGNNLDFTVTLSHAVNEVITTDLVYTDISTNSTDYGIVNNLSIPVNTISTIVSVLAVDDNLIEITETFTLAFNNPSLNLGDSNDSATGTITDNDGAVAGDGISVADFTVDESVGTVDFVITYTGPTVQDAFTVDFSVVDGSAISPDDYTITAATGNVSFPANTTTGTTQIVTTTIVDDAFLEADENFNITLSNISNILVAMVDAVGIGTITDNDGAGATDGISVGDMTVDEGAGTLDFVITYTGPSIQNAFTVDFAVADGLAISPDDYSIASVTGSVTFPANTVSGTTQTVSVSIVDDSILEFDEDLNITLSNISSPLVAMIDGDGVGTITDNDGGGAGDGISVADFTVDESIGTVDFVITYTGPTVQDAFAVDFSVVDGPAISPDDYTVAAATGNVSFPANTTTGSTQTVTVTILDDTLLEGAEDLNITLSSISNPLVAMVDADGIGTITDNDGGGAGDGISVADFTVNENVGTVDFVITYTGPTVADAFTVDFAVADGTAISPDDYTVAAATGNVSFPVNTATGSTQTVTVTILDDTLLEGAEDLNITLSNISNVLIAMLDADGVGTITDNEMPGANDGISVADFTVNENVGAVDFVITYTGPTVADAFTVDFAVADGTAISPDDYTVAVATGNVSFLANTTTGTTQTVTITIINDALIESAEELNITLSNISNASIALVDGDGIGVINDDDIDLDADDDGILDSFEDLNGDGDNDPATNPTNSDNDAYPDYLDIDSDDDGIPDNVEAQTTSGYIPPSLIDANGNGVDDAYETGTEIGIIPVNTDGEDLPDYLDEDSDNDNVPDNIEAHDYNQDGVADVVLIGSDKDNDGLDDSFEGIEQIDIDINDEIDDPINDLPNTDGDDESDYRDFDDDGDGIPTIEEDVNEDMDYSNDDWDNDGIPDYLDPDQEEEIDAVEIFNVVTPNNDMVHDFLMITGLELRPDNNLKIYNRWGILVYSTASYNTEGNVFDGTSQARVTIGKDDRLPVGTYFYLFDYVEVTGERVNLSGHLYLN